jgi:hypothetical protein
MVQVVEKIDIEQIKVKETYDLIEIHEALQEKFYVPDLKVKTRLISELLSYLEVKFSDPQYHIRPYIAYSDSEVVGFVIANIDPHYTSYSRKCGTFGWLHAESFEVCKTLMNQVELFLKKNKFRKVRGNINFPKNLGGIGIQFQGFDQEMLFGVAYNDPKSELIRYLRELGYHTESEYTCVQVEQQTWDKGKKIDNDIEFHYLKLKELYSMVDEIRDLAKNSFFEILPDSSGQNRIFEFLDAFSQVPNSFKTLPEGFNPKKYSNVPQFQKAWESCDLEEIEIWAPLAFDKKTGDLVGALLGLPDLFQLYRGDPITRANVDTAMVKKGYYGKGIFSALNNLGQLTGNIFGINYYEGTSIWSNNTRAVDTIFPHCRPIRKHYVLQKRI